MNGYSVSNYYWKLNLTLIKVVLCNYCHSFATVRSDIIYFFCFIFMYKHVIHCITILLCDLLNVIILDWINWELIYVRYLILKIVYFVFNKLKLIVNEVLWIFLFIFFLWSIFFWMYFMSMMTDTQKIYSIMIECFNYN